MAFSTESSLANISLPSGFSEWYPVANPKWYYYNEKVIPSVLTPFKSFTVANLVFNTMIGLNIPDLAGAAIMGTPGMALAASTVGIPAGFTLTMNRNVSGVFSGSSYVPTAPSPRLGFSVGKEFKHQAYIEIKGVGVGWTYMFFPIWITAVVNAGIDYCTNCRMKQVYLKVGRILSVETTTDKDGKNPVMWLQLTNKQALKEIVSDEKGFLPPTIPPSASGKITVWISKDGSLVKTTFPYVKPAGSISWINLPKANSLDSPIQTGSFFELDNSWAIEDPALLHEYDPLLENGLITTKYQHTNFPFAGDDQGKIQGVWVAKQVKTETETSTLHVLYCDQQDAEFFPLPTTQAQQELAGESSKIGGDFKSGLDQVKKNKLPIRIGINSMFVRKTCQNLGTGTLDGMFVKIAGEYYEIIAHPRDDTIVVSPECLTSTSQDKSLYEVLAKNLPIEIPCLRMWLTSEFYLGPGAAGGTPIMIWQGKAETTVATSDTTKSFSWSALDARRCTSATHEGTPYGQLGSIKALSADLTKRYRLDILDYVAHPKIIKAYRKYDGWLLANITTGKTYPIRKFSAKTSVVSDKIVNLTVEVDSSAIVSPTNVIGILFDEPYNTYSLVPQQWAYLSGALSTQFPTSKRPDALLVDGRYDIGIVKLSSFVPDGRRFDMVDFSFGGPPDMGGGALGTPFVFLSTQQYDPCISLYQHKGMGEEVLAEHLFFPDKNFYNTLVCRKGYGRWTAALEQFAVIVGKPESFNATDEALPSEGPLSRFGNRIVIESTSEFQQEIISTEASEQNKLPDHYWFVTRSSVGNPVFSFSIDGGAGVSDHVSLYYDEDEKPSVYRNFLWPYLHYAIQSNQDAAQNTGGSLQQNMSLKSNAYYSLEEKKLGGFAPPSKTAFLNAQKGISLAIPPITRETTYGKMVFESQLVKPQLFDVHALIDNRSIMVYGMQAPDDFTTGTAIDPATNTYAYSNRTSFTNKSRNCVMLLISEDATNTWRNPSLVYPVPPDMSSMSLSDEEKATLLASAELGYDMCSVPTMLAYNFKYASSFVDEVNQTLYIFGYTYEPIVDPASTNTSPDLSAEPEMSPTTMSLSMLKIEMRKLIEKQELVYPCLTSKAKKLFAQYLPQATPYKYQPWGKDVNGDFVRSTLSDDYAKILGGRNVKDPSIELEDSAIGFVLNPGSIASRIFGDGGVELAVVDERLGIFSVNSFDQGYSWGFTRTQNIKPEKTYVDESNPANKNKSEEQLVQIPFIYATGAVCPMFVDQFDLAFFRGDNLYFRSGGSAVEGNEILIVSGVTPHKIAVKTDSSGLIRLFYLNQEGVPRCSESRDCGNNWKVLTNW